MYSMRSTPLICCSSGATTVEATTSALAPGYCPVTLTTGGAISGYWAMGRRPNATAPMITKTIEITPAKIGRSMKKCEMRIAPALPLVRADGRGIARRTGFGRGLLRRHLGARAHAHEPIHDHRVVGFEALDDAEVVHQLAERHVLRRRHVLGIEHVDELAHLLGTDGRIRHEQRFSWRRSCDLDASEHAGRQPS